jgi:serine protease
MMSTSQAQEKSNTQEPRQPMVFEGTVGGWRIIEEGQPPVMIHGTVEDMKRFREANAHPRQEASTANDLTYHGGIGGVGVETAPKVYLVLWGSQWNSNDPSGEAAILESFYRGAGGSAWANSVTQYCEGVAAGTVSCNGAGTPAGNPSGIFAGVWADNGSSAPSRPRQSQIAAEAVRAAQHFGNNTAASNASVQYVIATATRNSSRAFGTQYCAYHSATSSTVGNIAYTNLPYITDAGASCGANFNGLGPDAGITIVGGHEMAETMTDQFPNGGWLDASGAENGDKCAWISSGQGASADVTLSTGTFAVQSLWSNAFNGGSGGCVLSYP